MDVFVATSTKIKSLASSFGFTFLLIHKTGTGRRRWAATGATRTKFLVDGGVDCGGVRLVEEEDGGKEKVEKREEKLEVSVDINEDFDPKAKEESLGSDAEDESTKDNETSLEKESEPTSKPCFDQTAFDYNADTTTTRMIPCLGLTPEQEKILASRTAAARANDIPIGFRSLATVVKSLCRELGGVAFLLVEDGERRFWCGEERIGMEEGEEENKKRRNDEESERVVEKEERKVLEDEKEAGKGELESKSVTEECSAVEDLRGTAPDMQISSTDLVEKQTNDLGDDSIGFSSQQKTNSIDLTNFQTMLKSVNRSITNASKSSNDSSGVALFPVEQLLGISELSKSIGERSERNNMRETTEIKSTMQNSAVRVAIKRKEKAINIFDSKLPRYEDNNHNDTPEPNSGPRVIRLPPSESSPADSRVNLENLKTILGSIRRRTVDESVEPPPPGDENVRISRDENERHQGETRPSYDNDGSEVIVSEEDDDDDDDDIQFIGEIFPPSPRFSTGSPSKSSRSSTSPPRRSSPSREDLSSPGIIVDDAASTPRPSLTRKRNVGVDDPETGVSAEDRLYDEMFFGYESDDDVVVVAEKREAEVIHLDNDDVDDC